MNETDIMFYEDEPSTIDDVLHMEEVEEIMETFTEQPELFDIFIDKIKSDIERGKSTRAVHDNSINIHDAFSK